MKKLKDLLEEYRQFFLSLAVIAILIDIFALAKPNDFRILFFTTLWVLAIIGSPAEKKLSILSGLVFFIVCPFFLALGLDKIAQEIAVWVYIFLVVGVVRGLLEFKGGEF